MSTQAHSISSRAAGHRRTARAFTLVEVIVAIGLLAVVSVIVGTIFASVGETVTTGQQVSNLNRFAARVERTMRRDFDNMVRENGFMVIRNELSNTYGDTPVRRSVALTATDASIPGDDDGDGTEEPGRPRRIDELMFFSRGDFTSRRTPLHRDMVAKSDVARVYYGHGQKRIADYSNDPTAPTPFERPRLDDPNIDAIARLGEPSSLGQINPNEYASDWSLLRHVTLLVPRANGLQSLPDSVFGLVPNESGVNGLEAYNRIADSSRQVALGPAGQGIFRATTQLIPYETASRPDSPELLELDPLGFNIRPVNGFTSLIGGVGNDAPNNETLARPMYTSGIVDVAVTDLDEIRLAVTRPWFVNNLTTATPNINELWPRDVTDLDYTPESDALFVNRARRSSAVNGGFPRRLVGTVLSTFNPGDYFNPSTTQAGEPSINQSQPQAQQLWMLDALPSLPTDPDSTDETGFRVRYESSPPGIFSEDGTTVLTDEDRLGIAILQADQEMLGSAVFVPRCTEFIVEWSLGIIDRRDPENNTNYGQPIWHGLRRFIDRDGNGLYDAGFDPDDDVLLADIFGETYGGDDLADEADQTDDEFSIREPLGDWVIEDGNDPENTTPGGIDREMVELVRVDQRWNLNAINPEDALVAEYAFGYQYQDWNEDADGDGSFDNDNDDTLRPWPWPRLVRITMRFVDPSDPELERTYQAEFRVPVPRGEI